MPSKTPVFILWACRNQQRTRRGQTSVKSRGGIYRRRVDYCYAFNPDLQHPCLPYQSILLARLSTMAPKPTSTAGKAPASGAAAKAPVKTTEGAKGAKKTSKTAAAAAPGEEKKKRRKVRKETYSSYIYKGMSDSLPGVLWSDIFQSAQAGACGYWHFKQGYGHLELVRQ
jgi:hypothetical protein